VACAQAASTNANMSNQAIFFHALLLEFWLGDNSLYNETSAPDR